jgi:AAA ATPase domain
MPVDPLLLAVEVELQRASEGPAPDERLAAARKAVRNALRQCCAPGQDGLSTAELIERASTNPSGARLASILVLRCLSVPELLPANNSDNLIHRRVLNLLQAAAKDVLAYFQVDPSKQTFEAFAPVRLLFEKILSRLDILKQLPGRVDVIVTARQDILRALNQEIVRNALAPYDIARVAQRSETLLSSLTEVAQIEDYEFAARVRNLHELICEELAYCVESSTVLTSRFYEPFLKTLETALSRFDSNARERFVCDIALKFSNDLEKRYPLGEPGRELKISIPLTNTGPGMAIDVAAQVLCHSERLYANSNLIRLGDIRPGDFTLSVDALIMEPLTSADFTVEISWGRVASSERTFLEFDVTVQAQPTGFEWGELAEREPYSTEVATGQEFIGRREKLAALIARLSKGRMESSYITGQKRVGKTSLAFAVRDHLRAQQGKYRYSVLDLDWGAYSHADPRKSLNQLGALIKEFLLDSAPVGLQLADIQIDGSLAPLGRLFDMLAKYSPDQRFVIILDEFDEIHSELYRMGPLADTFFSNIRSLSTKPNTALLLVGGEKMPFIMSAQGDQLNKFVKEELTYFDRTTEWDDFCEIITSPVQGVLRWNPSALNAIFNLTNGHLYYVKHLCKRIYARAIRERDLDITDLEVRRGYDEAVSTLGQNAFAHLWKDGIQGSPEQEEIVSLQRCRLLVAVGRLVQSKQAITADGIALSKRTARLPEHEIPPLLNEFCNRGIFRYRGSNYELLLPMFQDWLAQVGVNVLIADTLADDLAAAEAAAEKKAQVTAEEICAVTDGWPSYRGRSVGPESVRDWLDQVKTFREQRLLFKLLQNLRFYGEAEIRQKLKTIHSAVTPMLPNFIRKKSTDVRSDLIITYVDGPGKSGAEYARLYAEQNYIDARCVKERGRFAQDVAYHLGHINAQLHAVVIVDDIVGTGDALSGNLQSFLEENGDLLASKKIPIIVIAVSATEFGLSIVRERYAEVPGLQLEIRTCEILAPKYIAFGPHRGFWESQDQYDEAKALCIQLGTRLGAKKPLGYKDQGLLVVFPHTCPNNTLPLLHSDGRRTEPKPWHCLFPRPRT